MNDKRLVTIGILGAIAVTLGALGAHFLKSKLQADVFTPDNLNGFDTGVKYQIYHTIGMFILLLLSKHHPHKFITYAYHCFFIGIILFSGSLYFLCTRNLYNADWLKFLGPVTPIGGLFFVAGWLLVAFSGLKKTKA